MTDFRELLFWIAAVLFLGGLATTLWGLVTLSRGGLMNVYLGLLAVVCMGFILLDGVVSDNARMMLIVPALAFLLVWRVQQKRGRWPPAKQSRVVR